jgi:hypothetical protein
MTQHNLNGVRRKRINLNFSWNQPAASVYKIHQMQKFIVSIFIILIVLDYGLKRVISVLCAIEKILDR